MECNICSLEGVSHIDARGICGRCNLGACSYPAQRANNEFHGECCQYEGCGVFTCINHSCDHSRIHDERPVYCFPGLTQVNGGAAFEASVRAQMTVARDEEVHADDVNIINRFLNLVSPGAPDISRAVAASLSFAVPDGSYAYNFSPHAMREPFLKRVASLALRQTFDAHARVIELEIDDLKPVKLGGDVSGVFAKFQADPDSSLSSQEIVEILQPSLPGFDGTVIHGVVEECRAKDFDYSAGRLIQEIPLEFQAMMHDDLKAHMMRSKFRADTKSLGEA